jgi:hypothetical protein
VAKLSLSGDHSPRPRPSLIGLFSPAFRFGAQTGEEGRRRERPWATESATEAPVQVLTPTQCRHPAPRGMLLIPKLSEGHQDGRGEGRTWSLCHLICFLPTQGAVAASPPPPHPLGTRTLGHFTSQTLRGQVQVGRPRPRPPSGRGSWPMPSRGAPSCPSGPSAVLSAPQTSATRTSAHLLARSWLVSPGHPTTELAAAATGLPAMRSAHPLVLLSLVALCGRGEFFSGKEGGAPGLGCEPGWTGHRGRNGGCPEPGGVARGCPGRMGT